MPVDNIITTIITVLGSSGTTAIILALLQRKWAKSDKKDAQKVREDTKLDAVVDGLKVLTVDRVRYLGQCYIERHEISLEDKENLKDMYDAYKKLGGNGHLEVVMAEVNRLPIVDKSKNYMRGGGASA